MITLYSTGCPRCCVIARKMDQKHIKYKEINDMNEVQRMGFHTVPILVVEGMEPMKFEDAVKWVNEQPTLPKEA